MRRHQLVARLERLSKIIIRSDFKLGDAIAGLVRGRSEQVGKALLDAGKDYATRASGRCRFPRHHDVEHH